MIINLKKTAIIVPCYNEAARLKGHEFLDFCSSSPEVDFIFVDDGSTDSTYKVLDSLCSKMPGNLSCLHLEKNSGKAEAVRQGFLRAFEKNYDLIGYWDADLATPLRLINKFIDYFMSEKIRIVMGSRVKLLGRNINRHAHRHYLGRIFATIASMILHLPVYDTQCGAKLFRNCEELKKVFEFSFETKWIFDVEILARLINIQRIRGGFDILDSVIEHPLEEWIDVAGTKVKAKDFMLSSLDLIKVWLILKR